MSESVPRLRTPGVLAAEVGEPLARVLNILRNRSDLIRPIGRAGILRLYDRAAVEMVRTALRERGRRQGADNGPLK
jgi:hypothetical protein